MSYCKNRRIHHGTDAEHQHPQPVWDIDPTQIKDTEHNKQLQKAAAYVCDLLGNDRSIERPNKRGQQIAETGNRHERENHGKVYIKMLVPHIDIDCST